MMRKTGVLQSMGLQTWAQLNSNYTTAVMGEKDPGLGRAEKRTFWTGGQCMQCLRGRGA